MGVRQEAVEDESGNLLRPVDVQTGEVRNRLESGVGGDGDNVFVFRIEQRVLE